MERKIIIIAGDFAEAMAAKTNGAENEGRSCMSASFCHAKEVFLLLRHLRINMKLQGCGEGWLTPHDGIHCKREPGQMLTGMDIPAGLLGGPQGKETAAESCGQQLSSCYWLPKMKLSGSQAVPISCAWKEMSSAAEEWGETTNSPLIIEQTLKKQRTILDQNSYFWCIFLNYISKGLCVMQK